MAAAARGVKRLQEFSQLHQLQQQERDDVSIRLLWWNKAVKCCRWQVGWRSSCGCGCVVVVHARYCCVCTWLQCVHVISAAAAAVVAAHTSCVHCVGSWFGVCVQLRRTHVDLYSLSCCVERVVKLCGGCDPHQATRCLDRTRGAVCIQVVMHLLVCSYCSSCRKLADNVERRGLCGLR